MTRKHAFASVAPPLGGQPSQPPPLSSVAPSGGVSKPESNPFRGATPAPIAPRPLAPAAQPAPAMGAPAQSQQTQQPQQSTAAAFPTAHSGWAWPIPPQQQQQQQPPQPQPQPKTPGGAGAAGTGGLLSAIPGVDLSAYSNPWDKLQKSIPAEQLAMARTPMGRKVILGEPPLTAYTDRLGESVKSIADPLLGMAHRFANNNPAGLTAVVSALGEPIVKPLMSTPFGIPAMTGLHALLGGGPNAVDAGVYFNPLLKKLGLT